MIGLPRIKVQVVPYDPDWPAHYRVAGSEIRRATSHIDLLIEHIGSTSVPGLCAKPIVDIGLLLCNRDSFSELRIALSSIGWIYRGDKGSGRGGRLFVREIGPEVRTHHLHAYLPGAPDWERYLAFSDRLRASPGLRAEYGLVKQGLAKRFPEDRMAYTDAKTEFVERVLSAPSCLTSDIASDGGTA